MPIENAERIGAIRTSNVHAKNFLARGHELCLGCGDESGISECWYPIFLDAAEDDFFRPNGPRKALLEKIGKCRIDLRVEPGLEGDIPWLWDDLFMTTDRLDPLPVKPAMSFAEQRFSSGGRGPFGVVAADLNALGDIPADSCDVLVMTRASYMIEDPPAFLRHTRRITRPGGLLVIDWVHGSAETPALDLPGGHEYDGRAYPFRTTYCDAEFLAEFAGEFGTFLRHVNRPAIGERVRRLLGGGARRDVTVATYLDTLREALRQAGKHLVEPDSLEPCFKVVFRDARYFYPLTGKFYLHLLTVLRPVGK